MQFPGIAVDDSVRVGWMLRSRLLGSRGPVDGPSSPTPSVGLDTNGLITSRCRFAAITRSPSIRRSTRRRIIKYIYLYAPPSAYLFVPAVAARVTAASFATRILTY